MEANPGDIVEIKTIKETLQGTLLESHEPGIILLKLKSGYNIGIKKEDIHELKIIKKAEKGIHSGKIKQNKKLPSVEIIMTGGTISSRLDPKTGAVLSLTSPEKLLQLYPEMLNIVNIEKIHSPFMVSSEDMTPKHWIQLAEIAIQSLNKSDIQGIIITHGTDTLHYTSAALSFFLQNVNKPVVLTYSQRSSDRASSDAALNLICSARAAISNIAEVMLVGHASSNDDFCYAMPGTKVRKMHTSKRDAFKVINAMPFAKIFPHTIEKVSSYKETHSGKIKLDAVFDDKVAILKFFPGQAPDILDYYSKNYHGIILETTGLGHVSQDWIPKIKKIIDNGAIVCATAQTIYGRLNPNVYSPGRLLKKAGVIFLEDMLTETAFIKLGWLMAHKQWKNKIEEMMLKDFAGEISERIVDN